MILDSQLSFAQSSPQGSSYVRPVLTPALKSKEILKEIEISADAGLSIELEITGLKQILGPNKA